MGDNSKIDWLTTHHPDGTTTPGASWNPIRGTIGKWTCVRASEGCIHCYAAAFNRRLGGPDYVVGADTPRLDEDALRLVDHWKRPRRVFLCSMTDIAWDQVPFAWLDRIWAHMADAKQHTFLVLTKRPERLLEWYQSRDGRIFGARGTRLGWPQAGETWRRRGLAHIQVGVTCENQHWANERIAFLRQIPAAVKWLSCEPLLEPIDLSSWLVDYDATYGEPAGPKRPPILNWVVVGGETGPEARPMHPDWARDLRDQCQDAGVPYFFKGWSGPRPTSDGRLLDGRTHDEYAATPY